MERWIELSRMNRSGRVNVEELEEIYSRMVFCMHTYSEINMRVISRNNITGLMLIERRYKCEKCGGEITMTTWEELSNV
ncbi:MAG: hypothetical protein QW374_00510 [Candidatus Bathyarchaeia archaeon]|nr:hypothetical protein [Candidatus Bathyarchaeota archaeon]